MKNLEPNKSKRFVFLPVMELSWVQCNCVHEEQLMPKNIERFLSFSTHKQYAYPVMKRFYCINQFMTLKL